jgi:intracellular sulfur oxidation DsrE/DsrF family protein
MRIPLLIALALLLIPAATSDSLAGDWPAPRAPVVPEADGYASIPGAVIPPQKGRTYRAIFDATRAAAKPTDLVPAINMLASELNALAVADVPLRQAKFVLVFHGAAIDGLLNDAAYQAKFGVANPNLKPLKTLKEKGVEVFVCGQNLIADDVNPKTLSSDVAVASDALIVLMTYQNRGYALLSF